MNASKTITYINSRITIAIAVLLCFASNQSQGQEETFTSSLVLISSTLAIHEQQGLEFGQHTVPSSKTPVVIAATDAGAASFNVTGEPSQSVTASVVENRMLMTNGQSGNQNRIRVRNFTLGGSVDTSGNGSFNNQGLLNNVRVGATAILNANKNPGEYEGTATFRVVYN